MAELVTGHVLIGTLPRPTYPERLKESAQAFWHESALMTLSYAERFYASQGDAIGVAGSLARALMEESHARLAARGEWVTNEKHLVRRAGLGHLSPVFRTFPEGELALRELIREVRNAHRT